MDAGGIRIRSLGAAGAAACRAPRPESLRTFPFAQPESRHADRLARPDYRWFGAFDGERLVGAICLRAPEGSRLRHSASLNSLMAAHGRQRAGIGRMPTAHLIGHARSLGHLRRLTLTLIDGNAPARRLYDAFGFQPFGVEPDAIFHEGGCRAIHHPHLPLVSS